MAIDSVATRAQVRAASTAVRGPIFDTAFGGLAREHGFEPMRVEGALPAGLRGTLYRNGPALFGGLRDPHWFDGNGAVAAVRLEPPNAAGAVRVMHSPSADYDAQRARKRYAGFLQKMSWGQRVRALLGGGAARNSASINVLPWQGRLFALMETTLPLEIDPQTLATVGETDLDGVVLGAWNAHPRRVAARRATYQFGIRVGAQVHLDVYELPDAGQARLLCSIPLPGMFEVHDFFATDRHLVFVLPPLWCSPLRMVWEGSGFGALKWRAGEPTRILVLPIDRPQDLVRLETEPFFFWHGANAFERGGTIVLDVVRYPNYANTFGWLAAVPSGRDSPAAEGRLWRGEIDLAGRRVGWERRSDGGCEFPAVHPAECGRAHASVWCAGWSATHDGRGWMDRLLRIDPDRDEPQRIDPGPSRMVGEPVLVARSPAPRDAWMLCLVRDLASGASHLGVWDAARDDDEPVARVWFDHQLPPGLHGAWVPSDR